MAGGITEAQLEELKARIDLVELIESYGVNVRTAGATKKACCPFHHEKTPSFNINEQRGFYHCFGCGESGDAIKFVQKMEGLTFIEAVKKLAAKCGMQLEAKEDPEAGKRRRLYALMLELAQFYHRCLLKAKEAQLARDYLEKRALDGKTCEEWLIGYAPNGIGTILKWAEKYGYTPEELEAAGVIIRGNRPGDAGYHRFGGRLMFSVRDRQGRVVAFSGRQLVEKKNSGKYVNSPETVIFKKSRVLFGFDRAAANIAKNPHHEAIACEGQIDTIRLHLSGFPIAVASQGTAFTEEHAKMLRRVADSMTLVYDDDAAGHKATIKVAAMMLALEVPVRVVSLPDGDDPDSYLRKHSAAEFRALVDGAESIVSFQCRTERRKEMNPGSIDAIARISKAVLATIAACPSAILRASMIDEAAKLLSLPVAALGEELAKVKAAGPVSAVEVSRHPEEADDPEDDVPEAGSPAASTESVPGAPAASAIPPPPKELAFCEFLLGCETAPEAKTIDGMLGEFLPPAVFEHDFTRRFVEVWRNEIECGGDLIAPWSAELAGDERGWFDRMLLGQFKAQESTFSLTDIMQDFVRSLWTEHLRRVRGALPASGDNEAALRRMKLSMDLKRLSTVRWATVKDLIRDWL